MKSLGQRLLIRHGHGSEGTVACGPKGVSPGSWKVVESQEARTAPIRGP